MLGEHLRRRVLVAGATGRMGVLVPTLLARGHAVRAMTRDPASIAAVQLRTAGVEIVFGDYEDPASIALAAVGVDALFATGTTHRAGPDGERRHGRNLAAGAAAADVPHVVYVSGDGAAADSPLPLFRVKHEIEEIIRALPGRHTILAPVYFMENLFNPWNLRALRAGAFPSPVPVDLPLQQVAVADIAALAVIALERPDEFAGERIAIASDQVTARTAADALSSVLGRRFDVERLSTAELGPGLRALFAWLEDTGHEVDMTALHSRYADVNWHSYDAWLRSQRRRLSNICPYEHTTVS
jgi:uncharacterized protein YbjT (DUF2867 family)